MGDGMGMRPAVMTDMGPAVVTNMGMAPVVMTDVGASMMGGKKRSKKRGTRRMRGGFAYALSQAQDYSAPGMLLSPAGEARALAGMNPEWKLATDPSAFAPKLM